MLRPKWNSTVFLLFIKESKKINFILAFRRQIMILLKLSTALIVTCSQQMTVFKYCWGPECQGYWWLLMRMKLFLQKERKPRGNMIKLSWSKKQFNGCLHISNQHHFRDDLRDIVNNQVTSGHCNAVMLTCQVMLFSCASQRQNQLQGMCGF